MFEILISQPAACVPLVCAVVFLFWGLKTRHDGVPSRAGRLGPSDAIRHASPVTGRVPPALRSLYASCSAQYDVKFEMMSKRIRYRGV
jgi:hypothetical protein